MLENSGTTRSVHNSGTSTPTNMFSKQHQLKAYAEATLGPMYLQSMVKLPKGEDLNEWLAMNIVDFFNQTNLLYGTLQEFCNEKTCPKMSAGSKYSYFWQEEGEENPQPLPANQYIDKLMSWIQKQLDNERVFPTKTGIPFGKNFSNLIKVIAKRMFRVYAHVYYHHFDHMMLINQDLHLNTSFKHFTYFVKEFKLVSEVDLVPLADLVDTFEMESVDSHIEEMKV